MQRNETTASSTVLLNGEQAKSQLDILEAKVKSLRKSLKESAEVGDMTGWKKYNKELTNTQREMKQVKSEAFNAKKVLDDLSGSSLKDLYSAQKKIDGLLKNGSVKRRSKEWEELIDAQKRVKKEISNVNAEMTIGESKTSKFANGFNKYFASITAGIAALTGLTFVLKQFADQKNEKEDAKANLKALTGMDDDSIEWLTGQAEKLSTSMSANGVRIRKSSKEILDAFTVVGSAKPELLKNKEALSEVTQQAMILAEASKMDLGDAVRGLTIAMNMYGASAKEAAVYTNVLGAGAKEGAAEVSSQTESILKSGVAASQAGIPIQQLVGSIQALAEKGIKDEIAGTGLKSFFIKLQSGADETNPKIVGLQTALENLQKQNLSSAALQKRFGLETYTVAAAMIESADKVKFYTKAVTGTNIALEQAQINSQTMAAKMAQAKNEFNEAGMKLVSNLNPALLSAMNITTKLVKGMSSVASISNSAANSFKEQRDKVVDLKLNLEPLLGRYDELASKAKRSAEENDELKKIVDKVALAMPGAVTEVDKYGNAIAISTTRVREYINAQVALYGVKNKEQIEDTKKTLKELEESIIFHKKKIDEINKTGTYKVRTVSDKKTGDVYDVFATTDQIKAEQDLYKKLIQEKLGYNEYIKELSGANLEQQVKDAEKRRKQELEDEKKARELREKEEKKRLNNTNNPDEKKSKKTPYEIDLEQLEAELKDAELVNKKAYADQSVDEDVFREWQYQAKMDFLDEKLKLDQKYKKDTTATEAEIADLIISENEYWNNKIIQEADKLKKEEKKDDKDRERETKEHLERIAQIRSEFGLDRMRLTYAQEFDLLKEKLLKEKATEEQTARAIADFKKRLAEDYVDDAVEISGKASQALNNLVEMETIAVETKYSKQIAAAEKAGQDTTALQEQSEQEKKDIKKKYAGIDFAITTAKIISETSAAVMKAAPNIPLQIAEGVLGATQLGLAVAQFDSVRNLWTGGFTEPGDKYAPKGIVHAGEFVANQDAVGNRTLRRLFNVVDFAQKNNTVGRIDNDTIARALSIKSGFAQGGFVSADANQNSSSPGQDMSAIMSVIRETNEVNSLLLSQLRRGIKAHASVTGDGGINDAMDTYNQLIKNATRP